MRLRKIVLAAALGLLLTVGSAQALMITGAFTGIWFDDQAPGQGFIIQVVDLDGTDTVVLYWFTFDTDGNQVWLYGQGPVDGEVANMDLFLVEGGVLSAAGFDPTDISLTAWGQLTLGFSDCDEGLVSYTAIDPAIGSGEIEIDRLTQSLGDECTGGVSDNVPPGTAAVNLRIDLMSTGADPDARGRIKYEQNTNHTKLKVQVFKLDAGSYELLVDGESVGTITTNNGGNGKLFFRSPESCNWELLDFEPLDRTYEVVQDGVVFLTGVLDGSLLQDGEADDDDDDGDDDSSDDESCDDD